MGALRALTAGVVLFGACNGILLVALPQACLALQMSSGGLGLAGSGNSIGYVCGCLLFRFILGQFSARQVVAGGALGTIAASLLLSFNREPAYIFPLAVIFGLSNAAFWPFTSAWMLEYFSPQQGLHKARIFRHYNLGWTTGTAFGMYLCGKACERGYIFESLFAGGIAVVVVLAIVALIPHRKAAQYEKEISVRAEDSTSRQMRPRLAFAILLAAILANLGAIGTRMVLTINYAELNELLKMGKERMGLFGAMIILGQALAFLFGKLYEPWLGMRRCYFVAALALIGINFAFILSTWLPLLLLASAILGVVLALAFQSGLVAATEYFPQARQGTTLHEAVVGAAGVVPFFMGMIVQWAKSSDVAELQALQAPLYLLGFGMLLLFLLQCKLIAAHKNMRVLLPGMAA